MHRLERWATTIRHAPWLRKADRLWNLARPPYEKIIAIVARNGLERVLNGGDRILLTSQFRFVGETYEPEVWKRLMGDIRVGDTVADVGAYIGIYTIPLAKRVGPSGKVVAFEPDPENLRALEVHIKLNHIADQVQLIQAAVGAR